MGEVRVRTRLTNAVDEGLVRRGLLKPEQVRTFEADALVDTGAVRTVLPRDVVARLGLETVVVLLGRHTVDETLVVGNDVLVGQTVLERLDLFVDGNGRRLVPNPKHPDQAVNRV
ncbi:MAG: clan AA aspartic protease [Candidatus Rokubacteria bacterium]|nr:clan AA aspartic protease [Candidatus Rokubacteria bacterium]